ncbi:MAG: c-type cytochrome [Gallionella sp.]|jgi:hypothetical protein
MKTTQIDNRNGFLSLAKTRFRRIRATFILRFTLSLLLSVSASTQSIATPVADEIELGRRIYLEGILPSGAALTGTRFGNTMVSGASVACVNCHRRSGMGQVEGDIQVPPITGNFLFATGKDKQLATMDPRVSKRFNQAHDPYTDASLANAILHGTNNRDQQMNVAMPRYNMSESELKALTAYLKQLSSHWSPGVTESSIRFAMVITPDVDPVRRRVLIDMMRTIFHQKNGSTVIASKPGAARRHMTSAAELVLGTERNWTLDVWELQGAQETWGEQLAARYRSQPVFALVSGLTNSTWQPVHDFCEREQVPCWFPSVDLPVITQSQYSFYFSGGVMLEADVLARHLLDQAVPPQHVVQIYHDDDVGGAASHELSHALANSKISVENRILRTDMATVDALNKALGKIKPNDAVMLWLQPDEIEILSKIKPVFGNSYFSAVLAKAEHAPLSADWKVRSRLVYPYELPEKRAANLAYFHAWLNIKKLPLVDEAMQSESFFALNFLTDTLAEMLDNIHRDYLLERAETMLSKREGSKAEQETRDRAALGRPGDLERKHGTLTAAEGERLQIANRPGMANTSHGTTIYPHLSLGPEQRFASKGGYIVRFADGNGDKLIAESDWIVP